MFARTCRALLAPLLVLAGLSPLSAAATTFSDLFVFGDSLVDTGNVQAAAIGAGFDDPAPASFGYFEGRFANGLNLADVVNQAVEGTPLTGSLFGGDNYAFGGARARDNGDFVPDLGLQIDAYLLDHAASADPAALYLVTIGGNDARDILLDGLAALDRQQVIDDASAAAAAAAQALQLAGANHILFVGVPDIAATPETLALGGDAAAVARQISEDLAASIAAALPSGVMTFDTLGFLDSLPDLGLNESDACLLSGVADPTGPPTCEGFAFFDTIHPTAGTHAIFGGAIVDEFVTMDLGTNIPEPSTTTLLLLGFAATAYRRRA